MQRKVFSFLFLFCLIAGISCTLNAQEAVEQTQQSLLPEIDPQDIEIRSQFQARFPGLRRQPILGFNPKPRVFQIDSDRTPFIESEEAIAASVRVGELDRPEAPGYMPLSYANPSRGFARLGIGSFVTPEADVYLIHGFGGKNWVSGNLSHRSSNGHLDEINSSFRNLDATIRSQIQFTDRTKLKLNAGTSSDFNWLPPDLTEVGPVDTAGARSEQYGFRFGGTLDYNRTSISGLSTSFNIYSNQFEMTNVSGETIPGEASEWGGKFGLKYSWAGSRLEEVYSVYGNVKGGSIDLIEKPSFDWNVSEAGVKYDRLLNYQTDIDASFGVAFVTDAFHESAFYITPVVDIRHTLFDGVDLRGRLAGKPEHHSLREFRSVNRFISLNNFLSHQYNIEVRGEVIVEPLSGTMFTGGIQFRHVNDYAYFTRNQNPNSISLDESEETFIRSFYQPNFDNATFLKIYGTFSQQLSAEKFWVSADAYWQRPRLSGNEQIPFVEAIGIKGTATFRPIRELVVEGWADFSGSRFNPVGDDLSSFFLLGTRFELSLTEGAGIYAKLLNINDVSYEIWQGYEERGFQAFLGITYLF